VKLRASVVVPTHQRPRLLERCLAALLAQDLPARNFEIVIVHDGKHAATRDVVDALIRRAHATQPRLRYFEPPHRGPAAARNTGWRRARGEIIAFTDDDTIPSPDWLRRGLEVCAAGADAAWGSIEVPLPSVPTDYELDTGRLARAQFVTANCFIRRRLLATIGGFDERFALAWREDSDLYFRLLARGADVRHVPGARVLHPIRPGHWGVSLKQQRKVVYDALLFKKHRKLYRRFIRSSPRWDYYAIVMALGGAAVALASDARPAAIGFSMLWCGLTARLCLARLLLTSKSWQHLGEMIVTSMLIPPLAVFWRIVGALRFRVAFI
jgi:glycosyltransferase involved in cell wall biosynthesis